MQTEGATGTSRHDGVRLLLLLLAGYLLVRFVDALVEEAAEEVAEAVWEGIGGLGRRLRSGSDDGSG